MGVEIAASPEMAEKVKRTERLRAIDGDCTVWDPYALIDAFIDYWQQTHPEMAESVESIREITEESKGESRNASAPEPYSELDRLGVDYLGYADDFRLYCKVNGLNFLNPGAEELLQALDDADGTEGLLTTAGAVSRQTFKIRAQGLQDRLPYLIIPSTSEVVKARLMVDSWHLDDTGGGTFKLHLPHKGQTLSASYAMVVDDKPEQVSLSEEQLAGSGVPSGALELVRYVGPSVPEKTLRKPTPPGVREISDLRELISSI